MADHKYEPGPYGVCKRCGAEKPAHTEEKPTTGNRRYPREEDDEDNDEGA